MTIETSISANQFYEAYQRQGQGTRLKAKHIRQYRHDFVAASDFRPGMSVLELGCGNGLFLRFLDPAQIADFHGVDGDPRVLDEIPAALRPRVTIADFAGYFTETTGPRQFDRVALFDVLEHFDPAGAAELLRGIGALLAPGGKVVVRVPNMASPFGLGQQYNDVTHRAAGLPALHCRPQAYATLGRELRERMLTGLLSWFLAAPPAIWSPALIGVFSRG